ncbi:hypothetical protein POVWA2_018130 [Plasmodium ovale wallikeri]|uniref:Uncharacterized protein n=1 Tax=Plasmodium ovale wallikeri TaxID=864142 RepID=A0A1A8YPX4_PLAOA|nr:hypothetical protein POVWA1_018240 [Plasmodium ovale wallikeri]SBT34089.1 hypothetical protein POVWA2_018130 [Plasmodium ovale wallikeri]
MKKKKKKKGDCKKIISWGGYAKLAAKKRVISTQKDITKRRAFLQTETSVETSRIENQNKDSEVEKLRSKKQHKRRKQRKRGMGVEKNTKAELKIIVVQN